MGCSCPDDVSEAVSESERVNATGSESRRSSCCEVAFVEANASETENASQSENASRNETGMSSSSSSTRSPSPIPTRPSLPEALAEPAWEGSLDTRAYLP